MILAFLNILCLDRYFGVFMSDLGASPPVCLTIKDTPVRLYMTDCRFDNLPLMAEKIQVRSTDKGFVLHSKKVKQ